MGYCIFSSIAVQYSSQPLYNMFYERRVKTMGKKTCRRRDLSASAEKKPRQKREPRPPKDPSLRNKMYRYRLYPTKEQIGKLEWILCRSKELYNAALEERTAAYRMCGVSVDFKMQC